MFYTDAKSKVEAAAKLSQTCLTNDHQSGTIQSWINALIVRGNHARVDIHEEEAAQMAAAGYRWSGHTHPDDGTNVIQASDGDYKILKAFWQRKSCIYDVYGRKRQFER